MKPNGFAFSLVLASLLSLCGASTAQERTEPPTDEAAERVERLKAAERRALETYGTTDLSDLYLRAARHREREIAVERTRDLFREVVAGAEPLAGASWTFLGPTFRAHRLPGVDGNDSGLVTGIAVSPADAKVIFLSSSGGGVWRSTDGGGTWRIVTENIGVLQAGSVAIAPSDPKRVYAGTAAADSTTYILGTGTSAYPLRNGVGILGSTDGGDTWRVLTPSRDASPADYVWQILVDPQNPDVLLVAGDKGLQRSTDGGVTFTPVLAAPAAPWCTKLSRSGGVIFAGTWGRDVAGSVYKSTDGGVTWTEKAAGLPGADARGRVNVAVSPSDPNRVYALVDGDRAQIDGARSTDGGETWTALNLAAKEVDILATQGGSCNALSVDPRNPDVVHAGGLDHWRSTDGGASWAVLSDWRGVSRAYLHADQHVHFWTEDGTLYIGNDGGLFATSDGGTTFRAVNRSLETYLIGGVCHDPSNLDRIAFGAQDNGTGMRVSGTEYKELTTGDGFACSFHPADPNIVHVSTQNQNILRSTDGGKSFQRVVSGLTDALSSNAVFSTVLFRHPTDPARLYTNSRRKIWTTSDGGDSWTLLSQTMPVISTIADFFVSPANPSRMALVDLNGQVCLSTDGGVTWAKTGDVGAAYFSRVRLDSSDPNRLFVSSRDPRPGRQKLFVSTDGGATFAPISNVGNPGGLPDLPVSALEQDVKDPKVLWVGSFTGLYRSGDSGQTYERWGTGLPNVPVMSIAQLPGGARLRVGTYGRGIWEVPTAGAAASAVDLTGPLVAPVAAFDLKPNAPRPGRRVKFVDASAGGPSAWTWEFGDGATSHEEEPVHVFSQPGSYDVKLTVSSAGGTSSATKKLTVAYPTTGTGDALTYLVPVILTSTGAGGTSFSTELTLTNRSTKPLSLTFKTKGSVDGTVTYALKPGQEISPDIFAFLKGLGLDVPAGNVVTSLRIEVRGADDIGQFGAQVRVTTPPNADLRAQGVAGRFGLAFPAQPLGTGATTEAVVYGLQQTSSPGQAGTRSNLACVNAGGGAGGDLKLDVTYKDGDTGKDSGTKDTFTLAPFQFDQRSQPLDARGIKNGFATIRRTSGDAQFICYGVLNDNLNGDGSFVPMVITNPASETSESMVPVIVGTDTFRSELTIANRSKDTMLGQFAVIRSSDAATEFGDFDVEPGHQVVLSDVVAALRAAGFDLPGNAVATMYVQFEPSAEVDVDEPPDATLPTSQGYVGVRTYTSKAGGLFGLAYGYSPLGTAADTDAYVYGLQQTGTRGQEGGTRTNLAVLHALAGHEEDLQLEVTYFGPDGKELGKEAQCSPCTLKPGQFKQFNSALAPFGVAHGFARIRRISGSDQFLAYGVLNDQANDDGSYVPMSVP